jgi:hypothetical protein
MEEQPIIPTEPKVKKTADKKAYMREYKKKEYQENKEEMKEKNRAYYYKYKFNVTTEDHNMFGTYLPNVVKIRKEMDYLKEHNPELVKEILKAYSD